MVASLVLAQNQDIFRAAFEGCLAAMASANRYITDPNPADYDGQRDAALGWAKAVDTAVAARIGAGASVTDSQVSMIRLESFGAWQDRQVIAGAAYAEEAAAIAALMVAGSTAFAGTTVTTPSADGGAGSILVFRPGAVFTPASPKPPNVFTDAPSLIAALAAVAHNAIVRVDSSFASQGIAVFPSSLGTVNLGYGVSFEPSEAAYDTNPVKPPTSENVDILLLEAGVVLKGFRSINGPLQIRAQCTKGSAIQMSPDDTLSLTDGATLVLLAGSTSPLVTLVPEPSPPTIDPPPVQATLVLDGQVALRSEAFSVPLVGVGTSSSLDRLSVLSSGTVYMTGTIFGGGGTVLYAFDGTGTPLLTGPERAVSTGTTVENFSLSSVPQSSLFFSPLGPRLVADAPTGAVCDTWAEVLAWVNTVNNTVTDITFSIPPSQSYTLAPINPGDLYELDGITLHGSPYEPNGILVLADGLVLQDLAGITDGLTVQAMATTTTPLSFSSAGGTFVVDGGATLNWAPPAAVTPVAGPLAAPVTGAAPLPVPAPTPGPIAKKVPAGPPYPILYVTDAMSPFHIVVSDGGAIAPTVLMESALGIVTLSDNSVVLNVTATGGTRGPALGLQAFGGSGTLNFAHDATVVPPGFPLFAGTVVDTRLELEASILPSAGLFANAPANAVPGDRYFATDIGALLVALGPGKWQAVNTTVGLLAALPATGALGQVFYASDTGTSFVWAGAAWAPLGLVSGPSASLPVTGSPNAVYFQTDTNKLSVWNAAANKWVSTQLA